MEPKAGLIHAAGAYHAEVLLPGGGVTLHLEEVEVADTKSPTAGAATRWRDQSPSGSDALPRAEGASSAPSAVYESNNQALPVLKLEAGMVMAGATKIRLRTLVMVMRWMTPLPNCTVAFGRGGNVGSGSVRIGGNGHFNNAGLDGDDWHNSAPGLLYVNGRSNQVGKVKGETQGVSANVGEWIILQCVSNAAQWRSSPGAADPNAHEDYRYCTIAPPSSSSSSSAHAR